MLIISLSYYIGVLSSRLKPRLKHLGVLSSRLKPRLKNIPKRIKINLILVVGASVEVLTTTRKDSLANVINFGVGARLIYDLAGHGSMFLNNVLSKKTACR